MTPAAVFVPLPCPVCRDHMSGEETGPPRTIAIAHRIMDSQQRQLVKKYLDLLAYHWKFITGCVLIALSLGLVVYLRMPKVYQCTALLSYERQQINPARMAPERQTRRLRDTVSTLSELVMSRNNLEGIISQFSLYPKERQQMPIEDVIELMRKKIKISPSTRGDTFTVTFEGSNPEKVQKTTNALASKFIEENLKYREERATETSKYTEDELNMAKVVLDKKEQAMRDYKLKYYNEMPDQRESNLARLSALHEQYQNIQDSIQDLERTRVLVQEQVALRQRLATALLPGGGAETATAPSAAASRPMTRAERLQSLQRYLEALLAKYTERHPEVRRTRQMIAKLKQELATAPDDAGEETTASKAEPRGAAEEDPEIARARLQLKEIDLNIKQLRADQKKVRSEIDKYEKWVAAAPVREAEWNALTRDYNELRRHYDYLVAQNLQASSAEHLERKQKGSKFKIVDPARLPDKPFKPDFKKMLLLSLGAGLALGLGLVVGLDFIDTSFKDADDLEGFLGMAVTCAVPYLEIRAEARKRRFINIFWTLFYLLYGLLLLAALVYFWRQGQIVL